MEAQTLLAELAGRGATLSIEDGTIFVAPRAVLDDALRASIRSSKRELLLLLAEAPTEQAPEAEALERAHVALGPRVPVAEVEELAAALLACDQEEAAWRAAGEPRHFPDSVLVGELLQVLEEVYR